MAKIFLNLLRRTKTTEPDDKDNLGLEQSTFKGKLTDEGGTFEEGEPLLKLMTTKHCTKQIVTLLEGVEPIKSIPNDYAIETEMFGVHFQMATKTTPNIEFDRLPTTIPQPKNPHVKYLRRHYTYFQRGQSYKMAKELY